MWAARPGPAIARGFKVAKAELGTKRTCPETGKKFYDLNKDPIVSPYTGKSYPLSYFEETAAAVVMEKAQEEDEITEVDTESTEVELVSLEDADGDVAAGDDIPDIGDDEVELGEEDDTFLEPDEDEDDDDMSGIIGVANDDDEV
jgi:uncharacterized protein (TIGR02300 family)